MGGGPVVGSLTPVFERFCESTVDHGRCMQVSSEEADEERKSEDADRDRPAGWFQDALLEPDEVVERPVEAQSRHPER